MRVQTSASNLVTTRFGNNGLTHTCQQWTDHHHRAAQLRTFLHELVACQEFHVQFIGPESKAVFSRLFNLHTNILQQLNKVVDIADVGNVVNGHHVAGQQRGTNHLQGLVLGALRTDFTTEQVPTFNSE